MPKYTTEILAPAVSGAVSYAGVLRNLGLRQAGGTQAILKRAIEKFGLDTTHFLGSRANSGQQHKGGPNKKTAEEVLVLGDPKGHPTKTSQLRRALSEIGVPELCSECSLPPTWNGKRLQLQVDHRSGERHDNRPGNLRYLCPNCHSQTENYGSKNKNYK